MITAARRETPETSPPDEEPLFEIIDGERVEITPMGAFACVLANRLAFHLNAHAWPKDLGEAVVEVLFHLALPVDRNRRPDVAFISYERWSKNRVMDPDVNAWDVVPNVAVEVVSPTDSAEELLHKTREYFQSGVENVWVIYPREAIIHVYASFASIRVLTRDDVLDAVPILPAFRLPLKELFRED